MASYFDLPSQEKTAVASIEHVPEETRKKLGGTSLLSPAVSQLLDDLGDEHSDSSSEEGSLSEDDDLTGTKDSKQQADGRAKSRQDAQHLSPQTPPIASSLSPRRSSPTSAANKGTDHLRLPGARGGSKGSTKQKQPHMARFHSLRSMLFSANLEDKMKGAQQEEHEREEAVSKWKNQHEERQMHRPKTPEKDGQEHDGIGSRIRTRIRRMTSKEVPTMESIGEDGTPVKFDDRASTASSDNEYDQQDTSWRYRDADEESIDHSDVEDLVRWVSRRDPPSDGEARKEKTMQDVKDDSGHESLGQSDVDDLVRYVSRGSNTKKEEDSHPGGYSDVSTESDSELAQHSSEEEEDADDLVRWISHRDGSKAGPVRRTLERPEHDKEVEQHYDSDVPELGRWYKRRDETSGDFISTTPVHELEVPVDEPERGRPRSRSESPIIKEQKTHLRNDDIDELVRWVSRKDSQQVPETATQPPKPSSPISTTAKTQHDNLTRRNDENVKKEQLGMKEDRTGSLGQEDVDELVRWVSRKSS